MRRVTEPRVRSLHVMLTDREWDQLRRLCIGRRVNMSTYVREKIFSFAGHGHANGRRDAQNDTSKENTDGQP